MPIDRVFNRSIFSGSFPEFKLNENKIFVKNTGSFSASFNQVKQSSFGSIRALSNFHIPAPPNSYDEIATVSPSPDPLFEYNNFASASVPGTINDEFFLTGFMVTVRMEAAHEFSAQYIYAVQLSNNFLRLDFKNSGWWRLATVGEDSLIKGTIPVENGVEYTHIVDFVNKDWRISSSVGNTNTTITGTHFASGSTQTLYVGALNAAGAFGWYYGEIGNAYPLPEV